MNCTTCKSKIGDDQDYVSMTYVRDRTLIKGKLVNELRLSSDNHFCSEVCILEWVNKYCNNK